MSLKKLFAVVIAAVVCVVLCKGCYNPDTVATINGKDIPAGIYLYYQLKAVSEAYYAINTDGTANTAHSLNPVPIIYVTEDPELIINTGRLADVAPSILHIMGLPQPKEMTGNNLIDVTK